MKASLLVLGMLHRSDLHPYEMKRRLTKALVGCYLDVDVGTLYYAIRQLEKQGSIAVVSKEQVTRGGMRTVYRLTPEGKGAFRESFFQQFEADGPVSQTLYGVTLFADCVDQADLASAIRRRIARLDGLIEELGPLRADMEPSLTTAGRHLFSHIGQQRQLDRRWLKELLADAEVGGFQLRGKLSTTE